MVEVNPGSSHTICYLKQHSVVDSPILCAFVRVYLLQREAGPLIYGNLTMAAKYQTVQTRKPNRADHVWFYLKFRGYHKCVLCGAMTPDMPPPVPTPDAWMPYKYEKLTDEERAMCKEL